MDRGTLTKSKIERLAFDHDRGGARQGLVDVRYPGFGVRVFKTGRKTFFYRYRFEGREYYMSLGTFGAITLAQATEAYRLASAKILQGDNPLEKRRAKARAETVEELAEKYLAEYVSRKVAPSADRGNLKKWILPRWGGHKVESIRAADARALHRHVTDAGYPVAANRVISTVSKMINWAKDEGHVSEEMPNPCARVKKNPETPRNVMIREGQWEAFFDSLMAARTYQDRLMFLSYLFIGGRRGDLAGLSWDRVDLKAETVTFKKIKDTRGRFRSLELPLSGLGARILRTLPRIPGSPWVFPGRDPKKPVASVSVLWGSARKGRLDSITLHDIRTTAAVLMRDAGVPYDVVKYVLGHAAKDVTDRHYAFTMTRPARQASETLAAEVTHLAGAERIEALFDPAGSRSLMLSGAPVMRAIQ